MPGVKGSFLSYEEKAMTAAIEDVRQHKTPIRTAAKKFNVPRTTLKYKVEGRVPVGRKMGPSSVLTTEEEHNISLWVKKMARAGFHVTANELIVSVEKYIKNMKRNNPFTNGRPGRTWLKSFLKRNPSISKRMSRKIEKKQQQEKLKLDKALERERKKDEKLKQQKIKQLKNKRKRVASDSTDSSGTVTSGKSVMSELSENEDFENQSWKKKVQKSIDEHVIVMYDSKYYPGKIISVSPNTATVTSMKQSGRLWKWPDRPDVLEYPWNSVISHINSPTKVSKTRNVFSVPELDFLWN